MQYLCFHLCPFPSPFLFKFDVLCCDSPIKRNKNIITSLLLCTDFLPPQTKASSPQLLPSHWKWSAEHKFSPPRPLLNSLDFNLKTKIHTKSICRYIMPPQETQVMPITRWGWIVVTSPRSTTVKNVHIFIFLRTRIGHANLVPQVWTCI